MGLFATHLRIPDSAMILAAAMYPEAFSGAQDAIARMRRGDPDALGHRFRGISTGCTAICSVWCAKPPPPTTSSSKPGCASWRRSAAMTPGAISSRGCSRWPITWPIDSWRGHRGESLDEAGEGASERLRRQIRTHWTAAGFRTRARHWRPACSSCPLIHREVLTLRFEEDMKLEEIAEVAGVPLPR